MLIRPDARTPERIAVEWGAFPARPTACLQSTVRANRLLDWTTLQGAIGRAEFQDEYVEWRTVRDSDGKIRRVELKTEFPEYWLTLASYHPVKTLQLVARFAGESSVSPQAVYGGVNPFKRGITPKERRAGFEDAMLPRGGKAPWSPYNNGEKALCFMCQGANTLGGLIALTSRASFAYGAKDPEIGELRRLSGPEAIATRTQAADPCRNSDPNCIRSGTRPDQARAAIAAIWTLLDELRRGIVRDRRPQAPGDPEVVVPDGGLTCLLGFGARLFNSSLHVPRLVSTDLRPPELVSLRPNGVGTPFLNLPWSGADQRRPGEADLALQFIADTERAVNRAVVEI